MRRGQPATSVVRTIADLGRRLPLVEAVATLDMALHERLLELVDLRSWAGAHPRYRGVARLCRAIELAEPGRGSTREHCFPRKTPDGGGKHNVGVIGYGTQGVKAATESAPARTE